MVPDASSSRVSRFRLDGAFIASVRISADQGIPIRWDTAGGRLIAQRRLIVPGDSTASAGDAVVTLAPYPQSVDTIATLPPGQSVQVTGGLPKIRQFEPEPLWDTTVDGRLVIAMTNEWRFEVRDASGELEWVASRPSNAVRVTGGHREAIRNSLREMYRIQGIPPAVSEEVIDRMEFAAGARIQGSPHAPGTHEYLYCERGQLILRVAGERFDLERESVAAFPGDQRHSYENPGRGTAVGFSVVSLAPVSEILARNTPRLA